MADGRTLIDLFTAHGTVWLGHRRREVQEALAAQLDRVWITGGHPTPAVDAMRATVDAFLPAGYTLASLASTGMEANEQALRMARVLTGRNEALGLAGAMHGKSFATAALAWDNGDGLAIPQIHRVAAGAGIDEARTLAEMEAVLRRGRVGAVYLELLHATSLGWEASTDFFRGVRELTRAQGALLVCDEMLTGFFRTGPRFRFEHHGIEPDLIVFGKACGNGFPVAGVAGRAPFAPQPRMLLGSTFSNNALAAAAVTATLHCLDRLDPQRRVQAIEHAVLAQLGGLAEGSAPRLRGAGALWVLAFERAERAEDCARALHRAGVCVGHHGRQLRLLPALTIAPERLDEALAKVAAVLHERG